MTMAPGSLLLSRWPAKPEEEEETETEASHRTQKQDQRQTCIKVQQTGTLGRADRATTLERYGGKMGMCSVLFCQNERARRSRRNKTRFTVVESTVAFLSGRANVLVFRRGGRGRRVTC